MRRSDSQGSFLSLAEMIEAAEKLRQKLIAVRRDLHMHPELSGQEERTAGIIAQWLYNLGMGVRVGVGGHGVLGILQGKQEEPVVAYRADMDAIHSEVVGDVPYRSQVDGVKHGCGHDVHVAVGLGVATVLASLRERVPGTVLFIFQPAEETLEGAGAMLADGVLDDPAPAAIFALHTVPAPVGTLLIGPDVGVPGFDDFEVTLKAETHLDRLADEVLAALHKVSTVPPLSDQVMGSFVAWVTMENGPFKEFINLTPWLEPIQNRPDTRIIKGNVRCSSTDAYDRAQTQIRQTLEALTGEKAEFNLIFQEPRFPAMLSNAKLAQAAIAPIEATIGKGSIIRQYASFPYASEDFALFLERIPGAMFWLGVANPERGITAFNHWPDYDVDEEAIIVGTKAMASVLVDFLKQHQR